MFKIQQYIFLSSTRDSFIWSLLIMVIALLGVSIFFANNALIEQEHMAIIYGAFITRLFLAIGFAWFVCHKIHTMKEGSEIDMIISCRTQDYSFILGFVIGVQGMLFVMILPFVIFIYIFSPVDFLGQITYLASLYVELSSVIVISLAIACVIRNTVVAGLCAIIFYVYARLSGYIEIDSPEAIFTIETLMYYSNFIIGHLTPRFDLMSDSSWIVYGFEDDIFKTYSFAMMQAIGYWFLFLLISMFDFRSLRNTH